MNPTQNTYGSRRLFARLAARLQQLIHPANQIPAAAAASTNATPAPIAASKPRPTWRTAQVLAIVAFSVCSITALTAAATPPPDGPLRPAADRPADDVLGLRLWIETQRDARLERRQHRAQLRGRGRPDRNDQVPPATALELAAGGDDSPHHGPFRSFLLRLQIRRDPDRRSPLREASQRIRQRRRHHDAPTNDSPPPDEYAPLPPRVQLVPR